VRILLDESVPIQLRRLISGHWCTSVQRQGWSGFKNGLLLARADASFDLLITADRAMVDQQNLADHAIAVLVVPTNRR
jgi:hypothetical protein